jgi:UBA/TS-N domain
VFVVLSTVVTLRLVCHPTPTDLTHALTLLLKVPSRTCCSSSLAHFLPELPHSLSVSLLTESVPTFTCSMTTYLVTSLVDMGFDEVKGREALAATNNQFQEAVMRLLSA